MTVKIDGTNTVANPAFTGADTDTGLQCGTNELKLVTGGSARATVDSSGNIGVGVTPSSWGGSRNAIQFDSTAAAYICNDEAMAIVSNMYFNGSNNKYIRTDASSQVLFQTGSTQFLYAGSGTAGNNISFSTAATIDTHGIKFQGDTAANNALDDYDQGTWNPTVAFGGSSTGVAYNERQGIYVKIGNLVWASFVMSLTNNGSGTGNISLSLPFAVGDNTENRGIGTLGYFAGFAGLNSNPNVYASSAGATTCRFQHLNSNSGSGTQVTTLTHGNVTNSASWRGAIMYSTVD